MKKFKLAYAVAAASAVAVLSSMSPALAAGGGVSTGSSDIAASGPVSTPLCIKSNTSPTITLNNVGSVQVGTGVYAGTSQATITLNQFYFGPEAVYPTAGCGTPGPVALSAGGLSGSSPTGTVSCTFTSGSYVRVTNAYTITASGSCSVTGPAGSSSGSVTFVFSGNENACLSDFGVPNCEAVSGGEFQGVYAQV